MWGSCFSCSIPPPPPPPPPSSTTTPSTHHHQHNIINTTPSTQHHQPDTINTTLSTQRHQHNAINTTPSTQQQSHFAWQVQHAEHLQRGPRKSGDDWVLWTRAAFAWQAQNLEHLSLILRGRCSTRSTSTKSAEVRRRLLWTPIAFVWQVQHLERMLWTPAAFAWHAQHLEHLSFILRGRRSTWSTSVSFSVAGASLEPSYPSAHLHITIYTTLSTQHHLHYIVNTASSTHHHLHNTIYTTSSTQHHLHYIITYWQVQRLEHCHLTPSASFLLIPLLFFFVVVCSLFCFVDLFHTWMSEDIVDMWGYPVL